MQLEVRFLAYQRPYITERELMQRRDNKLIQFIQGKHAMMYEIKLKRRRKKREKKMRNTAQCLPISIAHSN